MSNMDTSDSFILEDVLTGKRRPGPDGHPLGIELAFTETFRRHQRDDLSAREMACLRVLFPAILQPIEEGDLFAGRVRHPLVGFSPEAGGLGYYCRTGEIRTALDRLDLAAEQRAPVEAMLMFWEKNTTMARTRAAYSSDARAVLSSDRYSEESGIAFPLYRMAGTILDYGKLLRLGIPGLRDELRRWQASATDAAAQALYHGMLGALDLLVTCLEAYAAQAWSLAAGEDDATWEAELREMAGALERLTEHAPSSLREAIQLMWLYVLVAGTWNYGRMDVYLGPFLAQDLDGGVLTEAEALRLVQSLWRLMKGYENMYNNRVFIGGCGRARETDADRFALVALEATRTLRLNQPQLSLRFYCGQNPTLMAKALTVIGEGCTFPILYNDEVNVPAVMKAFDVVREEAEQYTPFGCGEYALEHRSVGSPNGVINLLKCLEITLRNGRDPVGGRVLGEAAEALASFQTFDDLWRAYTRQLERQIAALAEQEKIEYDIAAATAPFLLISLLTDDCLCRGRGLLDGGVRHLGGTVETYGNINTADSLCAIDELVYRQKRLTLEQLVAACDANFSGHDEVRRLLLRAPKYGNDDDRADAMAARVHAHVCTTARKQAVRVGLDSYLVVIINNWVNVALGRTTSASPDGRGFGEPLANANNPAPSMDRGGMTAFLNSLVKLDPGLHAGAAQNMKFSRALFAISRPKLEALLATYWSLGGTQAMITVVSRQDLEAAIREPEKWGHLLVRVGGFSARFIDLPREVQREVLVRTLHE